MFGKRTEDLAAGQDLGGTGLHAEKKEKRPSSPRRDARRGDEGRRGRAGDRTGTWDTDIPHSAGCRGGGRGWGAIAGPSGDLGVVVVSPTAFLCSRLLE